MADSAELTLYLRLKDLASKALSSAFKVAAVSAAGLAAGAVAAGAALTKLAIDAAPVAGIKAAFDGITAGNATMLDQLRKSSNFMVKDAELMRSYNQAAQLVSKSFANELPEAMQYLQKVSAATGQSMDYMVNSLIVGVGRLSPKILDNLAIQVSEAEATQRAAKMFGMEADALSKAQQQAGMMNVVMQKLKINTAAMPGMANSAAAGFAQLSTALANLKDKVGLALLPAFQQILPVITNMVNQAAPILVGLAQRISDAFVQKMPQILATINAVTTGISTAWEWLVGVAQTVWPAIQATIDVAIGNVSSIVKTGMAVVRGDWDTVWADIKTGIGNTLGTIIGVISTGLETMANQHTPFWDWVRQGWADWGKDIKGNFDWLFDEWNKLMVDFWDGMQKIGRAWDWVERVVFNNTTNMELYAGQAAIAAREQAADTGTAMTEIGKYVGYGVEAWNTYWAAVHGENPSNPYGATGTPWRGGAPAPAPKATPTPPVFTPPSMPDFDTGADAVTKAAKEKAGETTADIASLMDRMLKDIASIYKTLSEKLPDIVTPVRAFMDRLWQVTSEVAGWTNTGGSEMRAFVDWIAKDLQPMWEKWADAMQPIVSIVQSVASISEVASTAMADMKASVTGFMDRALSIGREAAGWMNQHAAMIVPFVEWIDKDLRELWQKWADSLKPLSDLFGVTRSLTEGLSTDIAKQKVSVANMFDRLVTVMEEARRIVDGNAILRAAIEGYRQFTAPTIKLWNEALADLASLLELGRGMAETTSAKLPAVNTGVATMFSRLVEMMDATRAFVQSKGPEFGAQVAAFKEQIGPTLTTWFEGMKPLADLFDMGLGMMALMGTKVKKIQVPVTGFLSKLLNIGYLAQRWVEGQGADFPARMEALRDQLTAALTPMKEALMPVAAIMDMMDSFMMEDKEKTAWKANVNSVFDEIIIPTLEAVKQGLAKIAVTLGDPTAINAAYDSSFSLGSTIGGALAAGLLSQLGAVHAAAATLAMNAYPGGGGASIMLPPLGSHAPTVGPSEPSPAPGMQHGGLIPYTGLYRMHEGEMVVPTAEEGYEPRPRRRGQSEVVVNVGNLYGTDREAAEKFGGFILTELRRQGIALRV